MRPAGRIGSNHRSSITTTHTTPAGTATMQFGLMRPEGYRMGGEYHPFVDLRVLSIKPAGHHRNMKPLEAVTFEANSPG